MIPQTVTLMELFFAVYCNEDGRTNIPDCRSCEHNVYHKGCDHPQNPLNKPEQN